MSELRVITPEQASAVLADAGLKIDPNGAYFDPKEGFIPSRLGEEVQGAGRLRVGLDHRLWRYAVGAYRPDGDAYVAGFVRDALGERYRRRHLDEVMSWCRAEFPSIPERPDTTVLNVANGLLDWRTGELRPHDPDFPSIVQLPVRWDEDATCPGIDRFLGEVLPEDAVALALELAGYSLYADQPLRKAGMLLGAGRNGKSVFLGILRGLLGPANVVSVPLQELGESRFAAAEMYGKLANLCGDLDARALKRSDVFKILTGGTDAIMAERKYRDPFYFVPFATMIFSANEPPASSDQTDAYFDRWIVLPFPRRFTEAEADPHLLASLTTAAELSGLLLKSVLALGDLLDRGRFDLPASVREAGSAYRDTIDTVTAFLDECCVVSLTARVTRRALYAGYRSWCQGNGRLPVSQQHFAPRVRQEFGGVEIGEGKLGSGAERGWTGFGLREDPK